MVTAWRQKDSERLAEKKEAERREKLSSRRIKKREEEIKKKRRSVSKQKYKQWLKEKNAELKDVASTASKRRA